MEADDSTAAVMQPGLQSGLRAVRCMYRSEDGDFHGHIGLCEDSDPEKGLLVSLVTTAEPVRSAGLLVRQSLRSNTAPASCPTPSIGQRAADLTSQPRRSPVSPCAPLPPQTPLLRIAQTPRSCRALAACR